jgi:hypothetical protein
MDKAMTMRVELKHAVPETIAAQAFEWASAFLQRDPSHAGPQRVTSLYLDSPQLTFYRWHVDRRADRFKLRVRSYGDAPCDQVFAEVKHKAGGVGHKTRAPLPVAALPALLSDDPRHRVHAWRNRALEEFLACRRSYAAVPTMMVRTVREALRECSAVGELAVTVDRQVAYRPASDIELLADAKPWQPLQLPRREAASTAIVEVKYAGTPPAWMDTLLRYLAPYRGSFSKYAAAVGQCEGFNVEIAEMAQMAVAR